MNQRPTVTIDWLAQWFEYSIEQAFKEAEIVGLPFVEVRDGTLKTFIQADLDQLFQEGLLADRSGEKLSVEAVWPELRKLPVFEHLPVERKIAAQAIARAFLALHVGG